jgi:hypothetical protein
VFDIAQDDDFAMYNTVPPEIVEAYNKGEGNAPDPNKLQLDMIGGPDSQWNKTVLGLLLEKFKDARETENWQLPDRSDKYLADLIRERYKRVATIWKNSQRRKTTTGELETWDQVEQRLIGWKDAQLVTNRHATRRRNVSEQTNRDQKLLTNFQRYDRRMRIVEYMMKLKANNEHNDLHLWKWFASMLERLGSDGMSSEESSTEGVETVYRVKPLSWRRDITNYMDIIDSQRHKDADIFPAQGAKPTKRVRGTANPPSSRTAVRGLPRSFYNDDWLRQMNQQDQHALDMSEEEFKWYNVTTTQR